MATAKKKPAAKKPARSAKNSTNAPKRGKKQPSKSIEDVPREPAPALSELEAAFVEQYLIDLNGTKAYMRAKPGCANPSARVAATRLLAKTNIQEAVAKAKAERAARIGMTADEVVLQTMAIVQADVRDLMEYRVGCCRYCWGENNLYQRTAGEYARDEAALAKRNEELIEAGKPGVQEFDPKGGVGYDKRREPNQNCPECFGEGEGRVVLKDTSTLSPAAARLLAGIKQTKEGIEIKTHSVDSAMKDLFRHYGLYNDKVELTMPTAIVKDMTGRKG